MENLKNFQIIIIGAGLSGLTLAREICSRSNYKILILEKKKKLQYDKNWCFWSRPKNPFTNIYDNSWEKISVVINGEERIFQDSEIKYLHIKSTSFYEKLIKDLKKKKVEIKMNQKIENIFFENDLKIIKSNKTFYKSKIVFDSRPMEYDKNKNLLFQHFYGAEISFEKPCIDKNKIVLMDFQKFNDGINFFYILPFSSKKGLFETTYFSTKILNDKDYKLDIRNYLKKKFPNFKYKFKFKEKGIIPMFDNKNNEKNLIQIGTPGNWVRASTGYAFQNSFVNAKHITDQLLKNKKFNISKNKKIKFLDKIFCYYIANYSSDSQNFFKCFFYNNNFKDIVSFLVGNINFFKIVSIIFSLPKKKLFYSMFKSLTNN